MNDLCLSSLHDSQHQNENLILKHINIKVCSGTFLVVTDYSLSFTDKEDKDKEDKD